MKPVLKAEEKKKPVAAAKAVAVKAAPVEKPKEWHELLAPCDFDIYNYKTYLINEPDRKGVGMAKTREMMKSPGFNDGFSFWWVKYERYGDEGTIQYKFSNLLGGFMQRTDARLSKFAFGRMLMLGEEPNLNIEGVWMYRGQEIPAMMNDNPQFEYFEKRKLDFMNNDDDMKLVGEFFGAPKEGGECQGVPVAQYEWFK